jgi:hypothetical protein
MLTIHLNLLLRSRIRVAIPPLPNTPSWRGAQLQHRDNCTFTIIMLGCLDKKNEMGGKCSTHGDGKCLQRFFQKTSKEKHLGIISSDARSILK